MAEDVYVYGETRTPFGKGGGAMAGQRPDNLVALVMSAMVDAAPQLSMEEAGEEVGEIIFGNTSGAGEENCNVARLSWLLAGGPVSLPVKTVN